MKPEIDRSSDTWKAVKGRAEQRLEACRKRNDGALGVESTAYLRGRIAELKEFLALDNPAPEQVADEP